MDFSGSKQRNDEDLFDTLLKQDDGMRNNINLNLNNNNLLGKQNSNNNNNINLNNNINNKIFYP